MTGQTLLPYACNQGIKGLLQILLSYSSLPSSTTEVQLSQRKTNVFVSGPFQQCGIAVKCWTAAVLQPRNGWCLVKLCILVAYKENKAENALEQQLYGNVSCYFLIPSYLWYGVPSLPLNAYMWVLILVRAHTHTRAYSREYMVLITMQKATYICLVFK